MRGRFDLLIGIFVFRVYRKSQGAAALPLPPPQFPRSVRMPDTKAHRWFLPWLWFLLLAVVIPAGFGVMALWLVRLFVDMMSIDTALPFAALVGIFYFFTIFIFLAIGSTLEAARDSMISIDHGVRRVVSVAVIGISDVFFKGRSGAAIFFYTGFILILGALGLLVIHNVENKPIFQQAVHYMKGDIGINAVDMATAFAWGLTLTYVLLLTILPTLGLIVPSWRNMINRPTLLPLESLQIPDNGHGGRTLRVAHITDLHVVDSSNARTAAALVDADRLGADVIALTGDLTDKGSAAAWHEFLQLPHIAGSDERLVLAPGNHDLNTWNHSFWRSLFTLEPYTRTEAHRRAYLYVQVAAQVMGKRTWLICPFTGALRRLSDVYAQAAPGLLAWDEGNHETVQIKPIEFLASLFPMAVETRSGPSAPHLICLVWNTVKANRWALLNSVGELDAGQVRRSEQLLHDQKFANSAVLHLMHHQLAVPRADVRSSHAELPASAHLHTLGMGLETAEYFLRMVRKRHQRTCLLHGHHHKYFVCKVQKTELHVVSGPSSKFGTEVSYSHRVRAGNDINWLGLEFTIDGVHLDLKKVVPMQS